VSRHQDLLLDSDFDSAASSRVVLGEFQMKPVPDKFSASSRSEVNAVTVLVQ
jgi:hypothetical protein